MREFRSNVVGKQVSEKLCSSNINVLVKETHGQVFKLKNLFILLLHLLEKHNEGMCHLRVLLTKFLKLCNIKIM